MAVLRPRRTFSLRKLFVIAARRGRRNGKFFSHDAVDQHRNRCVDHLPRDTRRLTRSAAGSRDEGRPRILVALVADAGPAQHAVAPAVDDPTPPHDTIAAIGVVRAAVISAVVRSAEAERHARPEAPAEPAPATMMMAAMPAAVPPCFGRTGQGCRGPDEHDCGSG